MNFQECVDYLLSLGNEVSSMKLGLENIRKLLAALGDPQNKYIKVQVAGTNGKGSVCAFLNSICVNAGIKTGMSTSPHLISITERIQINSEPIRDESFAKFATNVRSVSERLVAEGQLESVPTFFEQVTAVALIAFAEAKVELAILETGLGGRLDATTAANAEIAAITRIDIDHQNYLGETLAEIAAEKAAIIHDGSEVVVGAQDPEAMKVILERCREVGVEPIMARAGRNTSGSERVSRDAGETHSLPLVFPPLGLVGRHQIENASIAVSIAKILDSRFPIKEYDILNGLKSARHPGRLELDGRFLFDGAHNIGGAKALRAFLDESVNQPITMIFGSMNDKDVKEIAAILFPKADILILTRPDNSRALAPDRLFEVVPKTVALDHVFVAKNVDEATFEAIEAAGEDGLILVTGSLYLVGEMKRLLKLRKRDSRSGI